MDHPRSWIDHTGDRPVVVKEATGGQAAERLRAEIVALKAAQHPGVVAFVSSFDDPERVELRTRFCGSRNLSNVTDLSVERVAGTMAALATTLADLHELGITHGRISPDHILISAEGRPVLCGFAEARLGSDANANSADVSQLGELMRDLLAPLDNVAPIPESRFGRRGAWSGYHRRALLNLADQASADDPLVRTTARALAHNIRASVPGATLAHAEQPEIGTAGSISQKITERSTALSHRPTARLATVGAGAAAVILVTTLAVATVAAMRKVDTEPPAVGMATTSSIPAVHHPIEPEVQPPLPPRLTTTTTDQPVESTNGTEAENHDETEAIPVPETRPVGTTLGAAGCSTISGSGPGTLASGAACPVALSFDDGVLTIADTRFEMGLSDAAIAIGNFTCSGEASAAVLDRQLGDLYVFGGWASPDQPTSARSLRRIESGSRLLAEPALIDGCHRLVALDTFGVRHLIEIDSEEER